MSLVAMKETTVWSGDCQPNHTYLLDGDKAISYIPKGSTTVVTFKKPFRMDMRGRKFVELSDNPFKVTVKSNLIRVTGSKGNTYLVDPIEKTCTCTGFKFKGACKHVLDIKEC